MEILKGRRDSILGITGKTTSFLLALFAAAQLAGCNGENGVGNNETTLETLEDSVNYIVGYRYVSQLKEDENFQLENEALLQGINDGLEEDGESAIDDAAAQQVIMSYQMVLREQAEQQGEESLQEVQQFMEENKTKENVQVLEEGIQYIVLEEGDGPTPSPNDTVVVNYKGQLMDSTVFDQTTGTPAEFVPQQTVPGFRKAITSMKEGARWRVFIHPEQGYGARGAGGDIGPNELLIFDLELLEVKKSE